MKRLLNPWWAILTVILITFVRYEDGFFVETARLKSFDYTIAQAPTFKSEAIAVLDIGENALKEKGQWPWKRDELANIISGLRDAGAGVIVLNLLFPEEDRLGGDEVFVSWLEDNYVLGTQVASTKSLDTKGKEASVAVVGGDPDDIINWIPEYQGMVSNIEPINNALAGVGVVSVMPEIDGVTRRIPMLTRVGKKMYPSLALETLRVAAQDDLYQAKIGGSGVIAVRVPNYDTIYTDAYSRVWINWANEFDRHDYTSDLDLSVFKDKIVIVGLTAEGLGTTIATGVGTVDNHILQANLLQSIIDGTTPVRPDIADFGELIATFVIGLLIVIMFRFVGVMWMVIPIAGLVSGVIYGTEYAFTTELFLIDASWLLVTILVVTLHSSFAKFMLEFLLKQQIKKQFGTYLSPALVEKLQKNPELLQLGGESKELSIMFTDVRGFTAISEHYGKDVQGLTKIMNRYMTAMTKRILDNDGTVDKYIGDAQMAFWNAPVDDDDHAYKAVKTGLDMIKDLVVFNEEVVAEGVPPFAMGLGINTDTVVIGNMGSDQRFDYTCLGDGVNLGARIEGQTKTYGVDIIIGENTMKAINSDFNFTTLQLDCIAVKGKTKGVNIYTVIEQQSNTFASSCVYLHEDMMDNYFNQDFKVAIEMCEQLKGYFSGKLDNFYDIWIERCNDMKVKKEWDGVYRPQTK